MCIWPFRLGGLWLRYATLQNVIPFSQGITFCYLATLFKWRRLSDVRHCFKGLRRTIPSRLRENMLLGCALLTLCQFASDVAKPLRCSPMLERPRKIETDGVTPPFKFISSNARYVPVRFSVKLSPLAMFSVTPGKKCDHIGKAKFSNSPVQKCPFQWKST